MRFAATDTEIGRSWIGPSERGRPTCRRTKLPPSCAALSGVPHRRVLKGGGPRGLERMVSRRLTRRSFAIAKANAQTGADAALTVAARTHKLLAPGGRQSRRAHEARLMAQEKVDAAI